MTSSFWLFRPIEALSETAPGLSDWIRENQGSNAVQPAFADAPPERHIQMDSNLLHLRKKQRILTESSVFLVRVTGFEDTMEQTLSSQCLAEVRRTSAFDGFESSKTFLYI